MAALGSREFRQFRGLRSRDLTTGKINISVGAKFCKIELSHQQDKLLRLL